MSSNVTIPKTRLTNLCHAETQWLNIHKRIDEEHTKRVEELQKTEELLRVATQELAERAGHKGFKKTLRRVKHLKALYAAQESFVVFLAKSIHIV